MKYFFKAEEKSIKSRQGCLALLTELITVLPGQYILQNKIKYLLFINFTNVFQELWQFTYLL